MNNQPFTSQKPPQGHEWIAAIRLPLGVKATVAIMRELGKDDKETRVIAQEPESAATEGPLLLFSKPIQK